MRSLMEDNLFELRFCFNVLSNKVDLSLIGNTSRFGLLTNILILRYLNKICRKIVKRRDYRNVVRVDPVLTDNPLESRIEFFTAKRRPAVVIDPLEKDIP